MADGRKLNVLAILPVVIFALLLGGFFMPKLMSGLSGNKPSDLPSARQGFAAPAIIVSEGQDLAVGFSDATPARARCEDGEFLGQLVPAMSGGASKFDQAGRGWLADLQHQL